MYYMSAAGLKRCHRHPCLNKNISWRTPINLIINVISSSPCTTWYYHPQPMTLYTMRSHQPNHVNTHLVVDPTSCPIPCIPLFSSMQVVIELPFRMPNQVTTAYRTIQYHHLRMPSSTTPPISSILPTSLLRSASCARI